MSWFRSLTGSGIGLILLSWTPDDLRSNFPLRLCSLWIFCCFIMVCWTPRVTHLFVLYVYGCDLIRCSADDFRILYVKKSNIETFFPELTSVDQCIVAVVAKEFGKNLCSSSSWKTQGVLDHPFSWGFSWLNRESQLALAHQLYRLVLA